MEAAAHEFLKQLLETPSPSGFERPIQDVVRQYVGQFGDEVTTDVHGNVIACRNPRGNVRVMLWRRNGPLTCRPAPPCGQRNATPNNGKVALAEAMRQMRARSVPGEDGAQRVGHTNALYSNPIWPTPPNAFVCAQ